MTTRTVGYKSVWRRNRAAKEKDRRNPTVAPKVVLGKWELRAWKTAFFALVLALITFLTVLFSGIFMLPAWILIPFMAAVAIKVKQEWSTN